MDFEDLKRRFTYHKPKEGQPEMYEDIRAQALRFAVTLNEYCPDSREKSSAMTKLDEVVMHANAAIARHG